jgi:hypothetical protein
MAAGYRGKDDMKRDLLSSSADSEIIITLMSIRELEEAPHGDYRRTRRA